MSPPSELTSHHPCNGSSFMYRCMSWVDKVCQDGPGGIYLESKWEWESAMCAKCLLPAQYQTSEPALGWANRKLHKFLRVFSGAYFPDQGWKVQCRRKGICRHQQQHSGCGGTDHTDEVRKMWLIMISSIQPLFILESGSLELEYKMDMLAHTLIFGMIIPPWTQMLKKLWHLLC